MEESVIGFFMVVKTRKSSAIDKPNLAFLHNWNVFGVAFIYFPKLIVVIASTDMKVAIA